jgi:hypothetical protein
MKPNRPSPQPRTALVLLCFTSLAGAVEPVNFEIRNNADLVAVCETPMTDPIYTAAIHFCHGFGVGFVRYHEALAEGRDFRPLFCFPPSLTRTEVLNAYVGYSKMHPEYGRDLVGDVMTKFLTETYPCPTANTPATNPKAK